ncbi:MAG: radical SAM protein [Nanoarchaeota archaeon]|nr:radical SAM protein [Nanoarchaeota archaeon]
MERKLTEKEYYGLGKVPIGIGAVLNGWQFGPNSVIDARIMTHECPHNCFHCFTDKKKRTLDFGEIKNTINQISKMSHVKAIDYLGEGEPTIDKNFFEIMKYTRDSGLVPIVFTDAATKLRDDEFVKRLYDSGASVYPKCDSLFNSEYQNWLVGDKIGKYFQQRNEAIKKLVEHGFNKTQEDGTTRIGFDMVVSKKNVHEVEQTLRYCRDNNFWVVFCTYVPAGRCTGDSFNRSLVLNQNEIDRINEIVKRVDSEYGFIHPIYSNFRTSPCVEHMCIYGNGDVSPCVGNETIVGNMKRDLISDLSKKILEEFPCHRPENNKGNCSYRRIEG